MNASISNGFRQDDDDYIIVNEQRIGYREEWNAVDALNQLIKEKLSPSGQLRGKVVNFQQADKLKHFLDLSLKTESTGFDCSGVVKLVDQIIDYSVKTGHPYFFQQLYHGCDPYGLMAAILIDALNSSTYTYDVGPVMTLIENEVIDSVAELLGWSSHDGIFTPGGSIANMYGINLARFSLEANYKKEGLRYGDKQLVVFCSDQAHYSTEKACAFMGLGTNAICMIRTDSTGAMIIDDLKEKIDENTNDHRRPLLVVATMGTTVLNGYDPLTTIVELCRSKGIWVHADICFGGAALHSHKHRHLLNGVDRVDSIAWCWHKVLCAPFQTSLFMCRHQARLAAAHGAKADYLFLENKHYDTTFDTGDASLQCGRRADAIKVWLMWKARGTKSIGRLVDQAFANAQYLEEKLRARHDRFDIVCPAQGTSVCFWVRPPSLNEYSMTTILATSTLAAKLSHVAPELKRRMAENGTAMIAYQPMANKNYANFFRVTFNCHPLNTRQEIDQLVTHLIQLSNDL